MRDEERNRSRVVRAASIPFRRTELCLKPYRYILGWIPLSLSFRNLLALFCSYFHFSGLERCMWSRSTCFQISSLRWKFGKFIAGRIAFLSGIWFDLPEYNSLENIDSVISFAFLAYFLTSVPFKNMINSFPFRWTPFQRNSCCRRFCFKLYWICLIRSCIYFACPCIQIAELSR